MIGITLNAKCFKVFLVGIILFFFVGSVGAESVSDWISGYSCYPKKNRIYHNHHISDWYEELSIVPSVPEIDNYHNIASGFCPINRIGSRSADNLTAVVVNIHYYQPNASARVCAIRYNRGDEFCSQWKNVEGAYNISQIYFATEDLEEIRELDWRYYLHIEFEDGYIVGYRTVWNLP